MLEYPIEEAATLLRSNLSTANKSLKTVDSDLDFIKDQITTLEVGMARVYNWDVQERRKKTSKPVTWHNMINDLITAIWWQLNCDCIVLHIVIQSKSHMYVMTQQLGIHAQSLLMERDSCWRQLLHSWGGVATSAGEEADRHTWQHN